MDTPNTTTTVSEAEAGSKIVTKYFKPQTIKVKGDKDQQEAEILILPDGNGGLTAQSVKSFTDEYKTAPDFRTGTAQMLTLDSFIKHVIRFKDEDSIIFADNSRENPSLKAVIDYHQKTFNGAPRNGDHKVNYNFPMSDEWKAWMTQDGKSMTVLEFAEFLEDRIGDVEVPPAAKEDDEESEADLHLQKILERIGGNLASPHKLMELSKGLKVNVEEKVHQAHTLASGETQLQFSHEHTDEQGAPIKVPNMFLINIPVFNSGDVFRIPVRLRYRIRAGSISWTYQLYRTDQTFDAAFDDAVKKVEEDTTLPVHVGKVET